MNDEDPLAGPKGCAWGLLLAALVLVVLGGLTAYWNARH